MVRVRLEYVWFVVVLEIITIVTKLSVEDSQRKIVPVLPAKVKVAPFVPAQIEASALTLPPIELIILNVVVARQVGFVPVAT